MNAIGMLIEDVDGRIRQLSELRESLVKCVPLMTELPMPERPAWPQMVKPKAAYPPPDAMKVKRKNTQRPIRGGRDFDEVVR